MGNSPGQAVKPGSMGQPVPGYRIDLLDGSGQPTQEGEMCLVLDPHVPGLVLACEDDPAKTVDLMRSGFHRTGDIAFCDADGYITYVGRANDGFKASDWSISPFELESVLMEHPAVAETAVVPSPDPVRFAVPKAFVVLAGGYTPSRA